MNSFLPSISLIIPVLNGEQWIGACLSAIERQEYPRKLLQVIVVDNGSTDGTVDIVRSFGAELAAELSRKSPYAARNKGLEIARHNILAFTDADCVPEEDWLMQGVSPIVDGSADLVAGDVKFILADRPSLAQLLDATINVEMRRSVLQKGVAKTANLFVHRKVFDQLGPFPGHVRSGGDVAWTRRATEANFRLGFRRSAVVLKRPRGMSDLLQKQRRVGRGHVRIWRERGDRELSIFFRTFASFVPRRRAKYIRLLNERGLERYPVSRLGLWAVGWLAHIATGIGRLEMLSTTRQDQS